MWSRFLKCKHRGLLAFTIMIAMAITYVHLARGCRLLWSRALHKICAIVNICISLSFRFLVMVICNKQTLFASTETLDEIVGQ